MKKSKVLVVASAAAVASWVAYKRSISNNATDYIKFVEENMKLEKQANIAIIGSGIGGSSAAFFLRNMFGSHICVDMYEKSNRIGGRMNTVDFAGHKMDSGAGIIHDSNRYMVSLTQHLGLEKMKAMDDSRFGIWNNDEFIFSSSSSDFINNIKLLWRYGFTSLQNLDKQVHEMLQNFANIYVLQDEGKCFRTPVDLLRAQGGEDFFTKTQKTARELMKESGISDQLIDELVTGVIRWNYGQDANVNGFTGNLAMTGSGGNLWSVRGGVQQICRKLIEISECNLKMETKVVNIHKKIMKNNEVKYNIEIEDQKISKDYDAVIVASPLEIPIYYFNCAECESWPKFNSDTHFQRTVVTFVQADIDPQYFRENNAENIPKNVMTTDNKNIPFSNMGVQKTVDGVLTKPPIYKIFSRQVPTDNTLKDFFKNNKVQPLYIDWLACPHYAPPEQFTPFVLDQGVFYVNSIERLATAMEMSAIGGRNAALLLKEYLLQKNCTANGNQRETLS